ncbi:MAG: metal-dependent hydrolase [Alphaproteobacteria bacterium]|nr:metal-dependent hydrolase [Alphaproteobacteria bacterium]
MMAGSHVVLGAAAWHVAALALSIPADDPLMLGAAGLGALLPDIDHPKSWAGRKLGPLSMLIAGVFGHRGVTHSLLAVLICLGLLVWGGLGAMAMPVVVGYLSHLAGDGLTISGVPLLWPWRRPFGLPLVRTGTLTETALVAALAAVAGQDLWRQMG